MAAAIPVSCPKCQKQLQVAADLAGKKIRCKGCGEIIAVKAPASKSSPARPAGAKPAAPAGKSPVPPQPAAPKPAAKPPIFEDDGPATYGFASDEGNAATSKPVEAAPKLVGEESNPYGLTHTEESIRCPHCAKEMDEGDVVCIHCGYNTQSREHGQTKRTYDITGQDRFMWLLPGILCVVGILALIGFSIFFWLGLKADWWDPMDEWMENTSFSMGLRVWELVFALWLMWLAGKFAFQRLIVQPNPPEQERF